MLVYFRIRNFKSVVDTTIDMRYGEGKAPNGYRNMETLPFIQCDVSGHPSVRLSPVMAIYGQNAGGKTTLVKAMHVLLRILFSDKLLYFPNKLHAKEEETTFEIAFVYEKNLYTYRLSYNRTSILEESLRSQTRILFEIDHKFSKYNFKNIEKEFYSHGRLREILDTECIQDRTDQTCTFFGKIAKNYPGLNKHVHNAYNQLIKKTAVLMQNDFSPFMGIMYLAEEKNNESYEDALQEIAKYLRKLDIDISDIALHQDKERASSDESVDQEMDEREGSPILLRSKYQIQCFHKDTRGELIALDLREESRGTQVLFGLLGLVLKKLRSGGVLIVDEMDRSLHPILFDALISLFISKEYNSKSAQLILTAHNTELLESGRLRTSQVSIVSKNKQDGTIARRLCDFDGVRNVKNFRKTYLNGAFSGIPFPII